VNGKLMRNAAGLNGIGPNNNRVTSDHIVQKIPQLLIIFRINFKLAHC
jgi:hypothetical protein